MKVQQKADSLKLSGGLNTCGRVNVESRVGPGPVIFLECQLYIWAPLACMHIICFQIYCTANKHFLFKQTILIAMHALGSYTNGQPKGHKENMNGPSYEYNRKQLQATRQTDRQTDGQTDRLTHWVIGLVGYISFASCNSHNL